VRHRAPPRAPCEALSRDPRLKPGARLGLPGHKTSPRASPHCEVRLRPAAHPACGYHAAGRTVGVIRARRGSRVHRDWRILAGTQRLRRLRCQAIRQSYLPPSGKPLRGEDGYAHTEAVLLIASKFKWSHVRQPMGSNPVQRATTQARCEFIACRSPTRPFPAQIRNSLAPACRQQRGRLRR
jgi:hypothetical protein